LYICSAMPCDTCCSASVAVRIAAASSPFNASRSVVTAASTRPATSAGTFARFSVSVFSTEYASASPWLRASIMSRRVLSSAAWLSASFTILATSSLLRPDEPAMVIFCSLPVALSLADTLTMPLASMSKVTSICGTPRRADSHDLVRIHALVGLLAEVRLHHLLHFRHAGGSAHQHHFVDLGRIDAGVGHRLADRLHGPLQQVVHQLLELRARQLHRQMP